MIAELVGAAQSVQALATLLKSANGLANYNDIVLAVSEVNSKLMQANAVALAAQEELSSHKRRIVELQQEVSALKAWDVSADNYECTEVARGVFVYTRKDATAKLEQQVKLCPNCFEQRTTSVLQQSSEPMRSLGLSCPRCKMKLVFHYYNDTAA